VRISVVGGYFVVVINCYCRQVSTVTLTARSTLASRSDASGSNSKLRVRVCGRHAVERRSAARAPSSCRAALRVNPSVIGAARNLSSEAHTAFPSHSSPLKIQLFLRILSSRNASHGNVFSRLRSMRMTVKCLAGGRYVKDKSDPIRFLVLS